MLVYVNQNGRDQVAVIDVDPYPARTLLRVAGADLSSPRLSRNGQLLHEARLADQSLELRVTDRETGQTRTLFRTEPGNPIGYRLAPAWSPDSTLIAFSARSGGNSEIFSIKPDGTGLLNLTQNPLRDSSPVFSADGREVFFDRDAFGRGQLYRMDANGRNQRRVTGADTYETQPSASADATHLAFAGDRESRGYDIFLLDLNHPSEGRLLVSRRSHEGTPAFSPDGKRLAFVATSDGNPEIYVTNVDGTGLFRVTRNKQDDLDPQFSNDGRQILFSSNRNGKFALYAVDLP
jgi:TolB protein